jgi:ABC-2 type transport system permease protein
MRKTIVIALRDYLAAVKTKSFLISLALVPVLMGVGFLVGQLSREVVDTSTKNVAIIDLSAVRSVEEGNRLGEQMLYQLVIEQAQKRNEEIDAENQKRAKYEIEYVAPPDRSPEALAALRLELSERVRKGELFGFAEIGSSVIDKPPADMQGLFLRAAAATAEDEEADGDPPSVAASLLAEPTPEQAAIVDAYGIRFSSKNPANQEVQQWLGGILTPIVYQRRLAANDLPLDTLQLIVPPSVQQRPLAIRGDDGEVVYESSANPVVSTLIPFFSVFLLFSLIATAAFPLTTNIIEEKQLRIAEVLLGSVRPFELMLGKLVGGVAISLTLAAIYGAGLIYVAAQFDIMDLIGPQTLIWFVIFAALATLMVGAMSVAAGAAVTNLKEAQNIQTPIVLLPMAPAIVAINVAQNPQGPLAQIMTWFPLTTPITSVMRITVRDGMPMWERFAAMGLTVVTTLVLVWIAGRIFRHGMLKSEKAAAFGDVVRWITRG